MTYKSTLVEGNRYKIETTFNGEDIDFHVVVAESAEELSSLVQFHLDGLANPVQAQPQPQEAQPNQSELIAQLTARIAALENK